MASSPSEPEPPDPRRDAIRAALRAGRGYTEGDYHGGYKVDYYRADDGRYLCHRRDAYSSDEHIDELSEDRLVAILAATPWAWVAEQLGLDPTLGG